MLNTVQRKRCPSSWDPFTSTWCPSDLQCTAYI